MRHPAVGPGNLGTRQAGAVAGDRSKNLVRIPNPAFGAHQRLGQINRILRDAGQRQVFVVQVQKLGERGLIGKRDAVAPQIARLDMRGLDAQRVAFPNSRRETGPGVRRELRRMRTAIHPDGARAGIRAVDDECDDFARRGVVDGADLQPGGRAHGIDRRMRDALVLQHRNKIAIPCIGAEPRVVVNRNAQVIARRRSRIGALQFILVVHRGPHSGWIEAHAPLCEQRSALASAASRENGKRILENHSAYCITVAKTRNERALLDVCFLRPAHLFQRY